MSLFFFHLLTPDGRETDEIGSDCENAEAAYLAAFRGAAEISFDAMRRGKPVGDYRFEVRDASDEVVVDLPFSEVFGQRPRPVATETLYARVAASMQRNRDLQAEVAAAVKQTRRTIEITRSLLKEI